MGAQVTRAVRASPLLIIATLMIRAILFAEPLDPAIKSMQSRRLFDVNGVKVPLLTSFYGIPGLDQALAQTTNAFAYLQMFPVDPIAYWQSLVFLTEYAGIYAILLLESGRQRNRGTIFRYPFLLAFFGQFIPIGFMGPLWFFAYTYSKPEEIPVSRKAYGIPAAHAAAVLPTILVAYYIPHFPCYFHPDLAARHWWNWVWQPYPVWGSIAFFVSAMFVSPFIERVYSSRAITRFTLGAILITNSAVYTYSMYFSGLTWLEVFHPRYLVDAPKDPVVAIRVIIQYDYICCFGSVLVWLLSGIQNIRKQGSWGLPFAIIIVLAIMCSRILGFGNTLVFVWMWKEALLASSTYKEDE